MSIIAKIPISEPTYHPKVEVVYFQNPIMEPYEPKRLFVRFGTHLELLLRPDANKLEVRMNTLVSCTPSTIWRKKTL